MAVGDCVGNGEVSSSASVDPALAQYLAAAVARLDETFEDAEERELFLANTLAETVGQEAALASDRTASHALERLVPALSDSLLLQLAGALAGHGDGDQQAVLHALLFQSCASRVVEALLHDISRRVHGCAANVPDHQQEQQQQQQERPVPEHTAGQAQCLIDWPVFVADGVMVQCDRVLADQCSSPVLRACLQCLSGCRTDDSAERGTHSDRDTVIRNTDQRSQAAPPQAFVTKFEALVDAIGQSECVSRALNTPAVSVSVQMALQCAHSHGNTQLLSRLIERVSDSLAQLGRALYDETCCQRVLEVCVACATNDDEKASQQLTLFRRHYSGHVGHLLNTTPARQIAVQKLAEACHSPELLAELVAEVSGCQQSPAASGHWWFGSRVPVALCTACVRLASQQSAFILLMKTCLQLDAAASPQQLVMCALFRVQRCQLAAVQAAASSATVPLDGSLLLQQLLQFGRADVFIEGMLQLEERLLVACCQSPTGSHVLERLLAAPALGDKRRARLLRSLHEHLVPLACHRHGSRVLEAAWRTSALPLRAFLAESLAPQRRRLRADFFGRHVHRQMALDLFANKKADWLVYVKREVNKRKMFADIVDFDSPGKRVRC